jgi:ABC-type antimicrobial peptide transport system permease subunit
LFGISGTDPVTLTLASAALIATGIAAASAPAWRAASVDPAIALRQD